MKTKTRITVTVDTVIAEEARRIMKELGLKQSTFVEVIYRALVDSETKPMGEVYGPMFTVLNKEINRRRKK